MSEGTLLSSQSPRTPEPGHRSENDLDLALIQKICRKDEAAFAELFERFKARVLNLAYRYMGSRGDAELITQDVFLRVWQNADKFRGTSLVWTWIYRITVNLCLTRKSRKQLPTGELDDTVPAGEAHQPVEALERRDTEELVQRMLETLPPEQRMAIVLAEYEQLSYQEIGRTMNKTPRAIATILFRARDNLRRRLMPFQKRGLL
jgi:RNA polymerase sigma-70 factor (ECF subfamily)